jgi:hypothetical protein
MKKLEELVNIRESFLRVLTISSHALIHLASTMVACMCITYKIGVCPCVCVRFCVSMCDVCTCHQYVHSKTYADVVYNSVVCQIEYECVCGVCGVFRLLFVTIHTFGKVLE